MFQIVLLPMSQFGEDGLLCCEPWIALVEFGVDLVEFSHVARYWHRLGGSGIGLLSCGDASIYIY